MPLARHGPRGLDDLADRARPFRRDKHSLLSAARAGLDRDAKRAEPKPPDARLVEKSRRDTRRADDAVADGPGGLRGPRHKHDPPLPDARLDARRPDADRPLGSRPLPRRGAHARHEHPMLLVKRKRFDSLRTRVDALGLTDEHRWLALGTVGDSLPSAWGPLAPLPPL